MQSVISEQWLQLLSVQGSRHCLGQQLHMGHHTAGLCPPIVLAEGDEIVVLPHQELADILRRSCQGIVGRDGKYYRAAIAQMGLAGEADGGISDPPSQFSQGIAGAGGYYQEIQQFFRSQGLYLGKATEGCTATDLCGLPDKVLGCTPPSAVASEPKPAAVCRKSRRGQNRRSFSRVILPFRKFKDAAGIEDPGGLGGVLPRKSRGSKGIQAQVLAVLHGKASGGRGQLHQKTLR